MEGRGLGNPGHREGRGLDRGSAGEDRAGTRLRQVLPAAVPGEDRRGPGRRQPAQRVAEGDWTPLGFSGAGPFSGALAFVGYGIAALPLGFDGFDGIDLKGKVAVMFRYEPQEKDDASIFDTEARAGGRRSGTRCSRPGSGGASAVVFVAGPLQDEGKDRLPALGNDGPESPAGIPVLQV